MYWSGPPAVTNASCEMPTTADLGRLSLEEAISFALSSDCRQTLSGIEALPQLIRGGVSKERACSDVRGNIAASHHLSVAMKSQWNQWLLEAWSRNAGETNDWLHIFFCLTLQSQGRTTAMKLSFAHYRRFGDTVFVLRRVIRYLQPCLSTCLTTTT